MPQAPQNPIQYIDIADFTPGIHSDFFSLTAGELHQQGSEIFAKDGAAQEDGTFGCIGAPTGGLHALPRPRAYLQDPTFYAAVSGDVPDEGLVGLTPATFPRWSVDGFDGMPPVRIPIVAAKLMPAFVGPARAEQEDIPATEPLSHDPVVYWHDGELTIIPPEDGGGVEIVVTNQGSAPTMDLDDSTGGVGTFGGCGASSHVVSPPSGDMALFPPTNQYSFSMWGKLCPGAGDHQYSMRLKRDHSIGGDDYIGVNIYSDVDINDGDPLLDAWTSEPGLPQPSARGVYQVDASAYGDGEWHLFAVAITDDPTPTQGTLHLIVDGIEIDSVTFNNAGTNPGTDWLWSCADAATASESGPALEIIKSARWEAFGIGMFFDDGLGGGVWPGTPTEFEAIVTEQGPYLVDYVPGFGTVTPGFVEPGSRPDLTSGDISFPSLVAVTYDWYFDDDGLAEFDERMLARLYRPFTLSATEDANVLTDYFDAFDDSFASFGQPELYGYAGYDFTRSRHADNTFAGPPFLIILASPFLASASEKKLLAFPHPADLTADGTYEITSDLLFGVVCHQNRVMWLAHSSEEGVALPLGTEGALASFERWGWTEANDFQDVTNDLTTVFVAENPFGYGSWSSLNDGELLLIKQMAGGVDVRGNVNEPTVVRLPGMMPTANFYNLGVHTPFGYIYGSNRGCWLWTGGDQSTLLSPQLNGRFLIPKDGSVDQFLGLKGTFSHVEPFVFAPNSWVFDTRTESWWRLSTHPDIEPHFPAGYPSIFYDIDTKGRLYAFPSYLAPGPPDPAEGWNVFCQVYDLDLGASHWRFTSQPLAKSRSRELRFREVTAMLKGHGVVTITITGIDGRTDSVVFTVDSDREQLYRGSLGIEVYDATYTIDSDSQDAHVAAPSLLRLSLGFSERQQAADRG